MRTRVRRSCHVSRSPSSPATRSKRTSAHRRALLGCAVRCDADGDFCAPHIGAVGQPGAARRRMAVGPRRWSRVNRSRSSSQAGFGNASYSQTPPSAGCASQSPLCEACRVEGLDPPRALDSLAPAGVRWRAGRSRIALQRRGQERRQTGTRHELREAGVGVEWGPHALEVTYVARDSPSHLISRRRRSRNELRQDASVPRPWPGYATSLRCGMPPPTRAGVCSRRHSSRRSKCWG